MGKTDKQWRLPANRDYHGKITMMEVKTILKEFDKNIEKPETMVVNSGELAAKAIGVDLMNIKAENGGKPNRQETKPNNQETR